MLENIIHVTEKEITIKGCTIPFLTDSPSGDISVSVTRSPYNRTVSQLPPEYDGSLTIEMRDAEGGYCLHQDAAALIQSINDVYQTERARLAKEFLLRRGDVPIGVLIPLAPEEKVQIDY
ncbi:hypothetical protein HY495_01320 [Candidatus Woesearchaeota archaeon]|nr:hypothetical protein [Candidatus Woesearchaeota archaeon]